MEASELFGHCVAIIDSFRALDVSADSHAEEYMRTHRVASDMDRAFILEIFGGYIRYRKIVEVVVDPFFETDGHNFIKSERHMYSVACYTILFRTEEMGIDKLTDFIVSQNWRKMHVFCRFFLSKNNLLTWIKDEWRKIYEDEYVNEHLLGPLMENYDSLQSMLKLLDELNNGDGQSRPKPQKKEATAPEPFELTQPKPKRIPSPEIIPKVKPAKPVPATTYQEPDTEKRLAEAKEKNKQRAQKNLIEANQRQFSCAAAADKTERSELRFDSEIQYKPPKPKAVPISTKANDVPVKLNAATILREEKLFKAKEEEMINRLEQLQAGAKDASDFNQWQNEMRQKDFEKEKADIERRRLEGLLSHEEAILAQKRLTELNRERAIQAREEAAKRMREFVAMKLKEDEETRKLVEQVITGHQNAKQAKKKIQDIKQKLAQQMNKESKELLRKAFEEAEQEMQAKQEIIRQIRAIESVPRPRHKAFDPTDIPGYGFFGEMSLAELRERLNLARVKQEQEQAERRDQILREKQEKEQQIVDAMETINRHRTEQTRAAAVRLEEKRRKNTSRETEAPTDPEIARLQQILEQKKQERLRRQAAERSEPAGISPVRMSDLQKEKKLVEAGRFQAVEDGSQNIARRNAQGIASSARASRIAIGS